MIEHAELLFDGGHAGLHCSHFDAQLGDVWTMTSRGVRFANRLTADRRAAYRRAWSHGRLLRHLWGLLQANDGSLKMLDGLILVYNRLLHLVV